MEVYKYLKTTKENSSLFKSPLLSDEHISKQRMRSYEVCKITPDNMKKTSVHRITENDDVYWVQSVVIPEEYDPLVTDTVTVSMFGNDVCSVSLHLLVEIFGTEPIPHSYPPMKRIQIPTPNSLAIIPSIAMQFWDRSVKLKCETPDIAYIVLNGVVLSGSERIKLQPDDPVRPFDSPGVAMGSKTTTMTLDTTEGMNWVGKMIGFYVDITDAPSYCGTTLTLNNTKESHYTPNMATYVGRNRKLLYYSLHGGLHSPDSPFYKDKYHTYLESSRIDNIYIRHHSDIEDEEECKGGNQGEIVYVHSMSRSDYE